MAQTHEAGSIQGRSTSMMKTSHGKALGKDSTIVGFALFAMFFGAGNLIFPPTLGQLSGDMWGLALIGFLLTDAILSCLGVFVVNLAGGPLHAFDHTLGKAGSAILNTAAILCLCVFFAMPRTAATTFELSFAPYLGDGANAYLLPFSVIFFAIVFLLACRKSRVVDIIGKYFTPTLLIGMIVLIIAGIVNPLGPVEPPMVSNVFEEGVRDGYQTMDVLGVAAFSIIILDSAIVKGYSQGPEKLALLARASIGAVLMLGLVYGGLTYLGATSFSLGPGMSQAGLLVAIVNALLGDVGMAVLGIIVLLACVTTAVALVSSCADFFSVLFKERVSYNVLLALDCVLGVLICSIGLDSIISFSDPVLAIVCPPFITMVAMLMFHKLILRRSVYQGATCGAFIGGLVLELYNEGVFGGAFALDWLPLYSVGFGWLVFMALGAVLGWLLGRLLGRSHTDPEVGL